MSAVLVINSGSSSFKYQLIDMETETELASGLVERIGEASGHARHAAVGSSRVEQTLPIPDHTAGFAVMLAAFAVNGPQLATADVVAVGHRVVQGGSVFQGPTVIDDEVLAQIGDLSDLAPLHNPAHIQGINAARVQFPDVPHVAVFDTSFHQTMAPPASTYAIPTALADEYGTPLVVYCRDTVRARARAYARVDPEALVVYGTKAFPNVALLRLLAAEGLGADVSTRGELEFALRAGVPGDRIVFHGNNKSDEELRAAGTAGAL